MGLKTLAGLVALLGITAAPAYAGPVCEGKISDNTSIGTYFLDWEANYSNELSRKNAHKCLEDWIEPYMTRLMQKTVNMPSPTVHSGSTSFETIFIVAKKNSNENFYWEDVDKEYDDQSEETLKYLVAGLGKNIKKAGLNSKGDMFDLESEDFKNLQEALQTEDKAKAEKLREKILGSKWLSPEQVRENTKNYVVYTTHTAGSYSAGTYEISANDLYDTVQTMAHELTHSVYDDECKESGNREQMQVIEETFCDEVGYAVAKKYLDKLKRGSKIAKAYKDQMDYIFRWQSDRIKLISTINDLLEAEKFDEAQQFMQDNDYNEAKYLWRKRYTPPKQVYDSVRAVVEIAGVKNSLNLLPRVKSFKQLYDLREVLEIHGIELFEILQLDPLNGD